MRFFVIAQNQESLTYPSVALLQQACAAKNVTFSPVFVENFDSSILSTVTAQDCMYRVALGKLAHKIEKLFLATPVRHFFKDSLHGILKPVDIIESALIHQTHSLPIIPTLFNYPNSPQLREQELAKLGNFPLVVKVDGGSHGVGVIKVDSAAALNSLADYLQAQPNVNFILRRYVDFVAHARLIVLGKSVVASIEYHRQNNDFRTNVGNDLHVSAKTFSPEIESVAVAAVNTLGFEFGGVDILIDKAEKPWIAEVNMPCYFPRAQEETGINIAEKMIEHVLGKTPSG